MASDLVVWTCGQCNARQAMTAETDRVLRASSATFYCVHGHPAHWPQGKSSEDKLREQLDAERIARQRAEQRIAQRDDAVREARAEAEHERRRANGYKGHATRITNRAKAGVCPCCNRTFKQLAAHMKNQHPEFTPIEIEEGASA